MARNKITSSRSLAASDQPLSEGERTSLLEKSVLCEDDDDDIYADENDSKNSHSYDSEYDDDVDANCSAEGKHVNSTRFRMTTTNSFRMHDIEADESAREHYILSDDVDYADEEESTYHYDNSDALVESSTSPMRRKKKIKNRHVKAAGMIASIWTVMVAFLVVALSVDWWAKAGKDVSDLCTLCGNHSGIEEVQFTDWPTRKPSSSSGTSSSLFSLLERQKTLLPPPENIAQVCSPSIFLTGPSTNDLLAVCVNACFPATCCVVNDEDAILGLTSTLESQGLGLQASIYLSSVENCYVDDNIATCDEYGQWCQVLYRLNAILDDAVLNEIEASCASTAVESTSPRMIRSTQLHQDCSACSQLACCYEEGNTATVAVERKRTRQHFPYNARNVFSDEACDNMNTEEGSLNAKICDAYGPYCNPWYSLHSTISIPSLTRPTTLSTNSTPTPSISGLNSSFFPTLALPSYYPTVSTQPSLLSSDIASSQHTPLYAGKNISEYTAAPNVGSQPSPAMDSGINTTSSYSPSQMMENGIESESMTPSFSGVISTLSPSLGGITQPSKIPTPSPNLNALLSSLNESVAPSLDIVRTQMSEIPTVIMSSNTVNTTSMAPSQSLTATSTEIPSSTPTANVSTTTSFLPSLLSENTSLAFPNKSVVPLDGTEIMDSGS